MLTRSARHRLLTNRISGQLLVLLITLASSLVSLPAQAAIPTAEREVLIAIYNSTDGDNWDDNANWKEPPLHTDGFAMPGTEGVWYGVNTYPDNTAVV